MEEEQNTGKKERGSNELKITTVILMIATAFFFDVLQFILSFIFLGWAVGIFAGLTFYVWFKLYNISFMTPKRFATFGGASLLEMFPIPFMAALPAWTAAISYLALTKKAQDLIPGVDITKLDLKL